MDQAAPSTAASTTPATRYCTSCQRTRPEAGGKVYVTGKRQTKLWRCAQCLARRQPGANGGNAAASTAAPAAPATPADAPVTAQ